MSKPSRRTSAGRKRCSPSKYGIERNTSRGNAFNPQPVSRVPSLRIALRTPFAIFDCSFLKPVSLRPTRWPAARPTRPPPLSTAAIKSGRNAGLFCQLPKLIVLLHQISQPFGGRIRRAVIDIDDLIDPAASERADDFRNQRRDVFRFVAHRHNDGNGDSTSVGSSQIGTRLVGLERPGTGHIGPPGGVRFYGAKAPRATLLRRPDEGPTRDTMVPSRWIANPSRRAANQ